MASAAMVVYCFDTLHAHFDGSDEPVPSFDVDEQFPLFVTWEIERQHGTDLRGCIGTLAPTRLENLRDFTFKSALKDRRFDPIHPQELHRLHCSVSLLIDYEDAEHYEDWEIGIHGIIIEFEDSNGNYYSATYLPDVASEQGWSHLEAVTSLMKKAGFRRSVSPAMLQKLKVTRYRSSKHKLTYQEYLAIKAQGLGQ
uniref:AMMECR1 domain-containing protein n=1 Tax=Globisporangium ultimum (strain ATCC 200006 / CBS 805.95 / DAOM BR144) TaxID=431595 RepID=K3XBM3_GLOUD